MTFRPLPVMTILGLAGLIVLILLGNWQWSRYQEKTRTIVQPSLDWQVVS